MDFIIKSNKYVLTLIIFFFVLVFFWQRNEGKSDFDLAIVIPNIKKDTPTEIKLKSTIFQKRESGWSEKVSGYPISWERLFQKLQFIESFEIIEFLNEQDHAELSELEWTDLVGFHWGFDQGTRKPCFLSVTPPMPLTGHFYFKSTCGYYDQSLSGVQRGEERLADDELIWLVKTDIAFDGLYKDDAHRYQLSYQELMKQLRINFAELSETALLNFVFKGSTSVHELIFRFNQSYHYNVTIDEKSHASVSSDFNPTVSSKLHQSRLDHMVAEFLSLIPKNVLIAELDWLEDPNYWSGEGEVEVSFADNKKVSFSFGELKLAVGPQWRNVKGILANPRPEKNKSEQESLFFELDQESFQLFFSEFSWQQLWLKKIELNEQELAHIDRSFSPRQMADHFLCHLLSCEENYSAFKVENFQKQWQQKQQEGIHEWLEVIPSRIWVNFRGRILEVYDHQDGYLYHYSNVANLSTQSLIEL